MLQILVPGQEDVIIHCGLEKIEKHEDLNDQRIWTWKSEVEDRPKMRW